MNKKLNIREIQLEEKKILDFLIEFLEKNKLKYFLCGGTLLGAIRHKGFIPWDDDIDISMPRPDYDKLQQLIKNNPNILRNNLYFHSTELGNLNMPFTKVYNYSIRISDWRYNDEFEQYLWVDIFPIDGCPDSEKETIKWFKKRDRIKKILCYRRMSNNYIFANKKHIFKNTFKILMKTFYNIIPHYYLSKKIIKYAKKYRYEDSKYVCNYCWGYGPREKMNKETYEEFNDVEFEKSKYKGLIKYDEYLTQIYGDYMTLPPKEKRITHNIEAWRVDQNEKKRK